MALLQVNIEAIIPVNRHLFLVTAGSDFDDTSMVLTFSSGASSDDTECMNVTIMDDDALEAEETFSVTLTESDNDVDAVDIITAVSITDNDCE